MRLERLTRGHVVAAPPDEAFVTWDDLEPRTARASRLEELAIDEIKTHQRERRVLRSETPAGVVQEIYGLLLGHYIIRKMMCDAAESVHVAPRQLSFVNSLKILRCRLAEAPRNSQGLQQWYANLLAEVAEERLPPRRDRVNPRVIKQKMSHWLKKRQNHYEFPQPTKKFPSSIVMMN